jgi:hypothetical protein
MGDARKSGARVLVTTEKDAQNLAGADFADFRLYIAVIEFEIAKEDLFWAAIQRRLDARKAGV